MSSGSASRGSNQNIPNKRDRLHQIHRWMIYTYGRKSKLRVERLPYQAKICLTNAEGFLMSGEVEEALGESLYYELRKSVKDIINGLNVSMEIAEGEDGRLGGT